MTTKREQTIALSKVRPDKFSTFVSCGECGEDSTLYWSEEAQGWIMLHENVETDFDHPFYPEV